MCAHARFAILVLYLCADNLILIFAGIECTDIVHMVEFLAGKGLMAK